MLNCLRSRQLTLLIERSTRWVTGSLCTGNNHLLVKDPNTQAWGFSLTVWELTINVVITETCLGAACNLLPVQESHAMGPETAWSHRSPNRCLVSFASYKSTSKNFWTDVSGCPTTTLGWKKSSPLKPSGAPGFPILAPTCSIRIRAGYICSWNLDKNR